MMVVYKKKYERTGTKWREVHDLYIRENHDKLTPQEMAEVLPFSKRHIENKIYELGFKPKTVKKPRTFYKELKPAMASEKPNLLDLAEKKITGFRRETMCIHYEGNRLRKLSIAQVAEMVGL
jgi:hypothetical protein